MEYRRGLTFIEIILALGMGAVIMIVASRFAATIGGLEKLVSESLTIEQDLNQAMQLLVTEIRSAGPSETGGYAIESAATSSFTFYSDIDRDGLIDRVRYFLETSTLQKGIVAPTGTPAVYASSSETIISFVKNVKIGSSSFEYFGSSATSTATPLSFPVTLSDIRFMRVTLTADLTSTTPRAATYSHTVTIRNLRSN